MPTSVPGAPPRPATPVALLRVLIVVALAIVGSFWSHPTNAEAAAFYLWSLVWLPWSIAALFIGEGRNGRVGREGGVIGDLVVLLISLILLPHAADLLLPGLLLVAIATWLVWPELPRWLPTAVIISATTVILLATQPSHVGVIRAAAFGLVLLLVCVLWMQIDVVTRRAEVLTSSLRTRAETVLAGVPHPLVVTDLTGHLVSQNNATSEALGQEPEPGSPCAQTLALHHGERALDCSHGCALLSLCRSSTDAVEVWRVGPTGARQPLLASAAEIHDGSGRLVEVVHSLRDITRLKEADEAKTTFLATTSHELKTPLTVINGYADLLIRDDSNEELRRQGLAAIATRGKELASIVERLLMSSQIESGRMSINLHAADVVSLVRERVETFAIVSGHEVILRADDRTPAAAVDVVAFATIVDHLLDNAAKYSDEDSRITVTVNPADSAWVDVAVSDEGAGMTPDQRQQCFDKFWQADGSDSRSRGGTGLGLFIVKSLAEGMGGAVTAASTLGEGTTFTVSLPAAGENVVPVPRVTVEAEPSMIREFMRQIGVPGGGAA